MDAIEAFKAEWWVSRDAGEAKQSDAVLALMYAAAGPWTCAWASREVLL
jgi:hypothetical protein